MTPQAAIRTLSTRREQREMQMAKVSRTTAEHVQDYGPAEDRTTTADGYTMGFTTIREDSDLAPALRQSARWTLLVPALGLRRDAVGSIFTFGDRTEEYEAGDAFYTPPGHTPAAMPAPSS